jgi:peptide/nickel transport system permease protein
MVHRSGEPLSADVTGLVLRRLAGAIPLLLGVATIIFFLISLAPGDPTTLMLSPGLTAEAAEQMRVNMGLDEAIHLRYLKWLGATLTGDFGHSFSHAQPVSSVLLSVLPNTLLLSAAALMVAFALGIVLGAVQAVRQYSLVDSSLSVVLLFFYSMPSFWLALMLILGLSLFPQLWGLPFALPTSAMVSVDYDQLSLGARLLDRVAHLILPTVSLAVVLTAGIARYTRSSMLEVVRQDFVRTAQAKGLPERAIVFRHALRNALLPVVTLLGLYIPMLLSGTVLIEVIFAWPGMGRTLFNAIVSRDYPLVMGGAFLFATMVVLANMLADVLYMIVDPRIRQGRAADA